MWNTILASILVSVVTALAGILGKVVNDWSAREKAKAEQDKALSEELTANDVRYQAIDALEKGIVTIGETVVRGLKEKSADGKLGTKDIYDVQRLAIAEAVKIATNPKVITFLTTTGFSSLVAILTSIVQGGKPTKAKLSTEK